MSSERQKMRARDIPEGVWPQAIRAGSSVRLLTEPRTALTASEPTLRVTFLEAVSDKLTHLASS